VLIATIFIYSKRTSAQGCSVFNTCFTMSDSLVCMQTSTGSVTIQHWSPPGSTYNTYCSSGSGRGFRRLGTGSFNFTCLISYKDAFPGCITGSSFTVDGVEYSYGSEIVLNEGVYQIQYFLELSNYPNQEGNCTLVITESCVNISEGCTDEEACNFSIDAIIDDNSCFYGVCQDETACNFDPLSTCSVDNSICIYSGCVYDIACNYNPEAGCDDGSCEFESCAGCTYEDALNYEAESALDNGSCVFEECSLACSEDLNGDEQINSADLIILLSAFGGSCIED